MTWRESGGSAPETVQPPTWGERSKQCGCKVGGVIHVPGGPSPAYAGVYVSGGGYAAAYNPPCSAEPFFSAAAVKSMLISFVFFRLMQRLFCLCWDSLLLVMCPITAVSPANLTVWQLGCFAEQSYISRVNSRGYTVPGGASTKNDGGGGDVMDFERLSPTQRSDCKERSPVRVLQVFASKVWKMIVLKANVKST